MHSYVMHMYLIKCSHLNLCQKGVEIVWLFLLLCGVVVCVCFFFKGIFEYRDIDARFFVFKFVYYFILLYITLYGNMYE